MTDKITITKPDDWHLHLRDHAGMSSVVKDSARYFKRALIMPNLVTPIATVEQASAYRERILNALPFDSTFEPLMTLYLTAETTPDEIIHAQKSGFIFAVKLFPAGATTNSSAGIQTLDQCTAVFETMQKIGMPLSVHGEVTDEEIDIFDREKIFIERVLDVLIQRFPNLKIIMEHLTTREAVHYVEESSQNLAATITPHHLLLNRNDLLVYVNIQGAFQDKINKYLLIGVPATISFYITLYKVRYMWIDKKIADLKITHKINYNALKKEFIVSRSWEKENLRITKSFAEAQQLMSKVDYLKVVALSRLEKDRKYRIKVKAEVRKETQSSYLPNVHSYASKLNLKTQLYTIDFIY